MGGPNGRRRYGTSRYAIVPTAGRDATPGAGGDARTPRGPKPLVLDVGVMLPRWRRAKRATENLAPGLHQRAGAQLALDESVDDRCHDHAADAEGGLADQDGHEDLPGLGVRLAADDARVGQVLELVDDDQEEERGDGRPRRDAEGENHDDGV